MPNPAPSSRYDSPWKAALTHAFHDFMEFFFPQRCARIDWIKPPRFCDKELARIGFGDAPHGLLVDKLLEVLQPVCLGHFGPPAHPASRHDQLYAAKWQLTKLVYQHGWTKKRILILFNVIN